MRFKEKKEMAIKKIYEKLPLDIADYIVKDKNASIEIMQEIERLINNQIIDFNILKNFVNEFDVFDDRILLLEQLSDLPKELKKIIFSGRFSYSQMSFIHSVHVSERDRDLNKLKYIINENFTFNDMFWISKLYDEIKEAEYKLEIIEKKIENYNNFQDMIMNKIQENHIEYDKIKELLNLNVSKVKLLKE